MSNAWNAAQANTVSRDEAKRRILSMASEQGIEGAFKVFHNGNLVATPDDLPETVNMDNIRVSEVLDQASLTEPYWFEWRGEVVAIF